MDADGGLAIPTMIEARVVSHRDHLYLIPHSGPPHLDQNHSLVRLAEDSISAACASLRSIHDDGGRLSGRFMIQPLAFMDDGVLHAVLIEILECGGDRAPGSPSDPLAALPIKRDR